MISAKNLLKIFINTLIGLGLVLIWLQFVDFKEIIISLSRVSPANTLPIIVFVFTSQILRSIRLKIFLNPVKNIKLTDLIFLNGAATMLNFLIPIRAGEIAKGIYLSTNHKIPIKKALVWIFLDRFIDFLAVLALVGPLLLLIPTNLPQNIIFITILIFIIVIFFLYLTLYKVNIFQKILNFLMQLLILNIIKIYFERISKFFLESFSIFKRKPHELGLIFLVTAAAYASDAAIWYFTFLALGSTQDFVKMYLAQLLSALTYLIPAAPGYVGSAEASGLLIFSGVFGIDPNLSSAMIVLFHVITAVFVICFGIFSIYFLKIDLSIILKKIFRRGV